MPPTKRNSGSAESISIVERLDAESKRLARQLNDLQFIYAFYGLFDGAALCYSSISLYFSVFYSETDFSSSSGMMHDWVGTSTGAAVAATETIALAVFALLANLIDDKEQDTFKKFLAYAWSVTRDSAKAMKNGYKGMRSTLQALSVLSGYDLRYMIVPVGLAFGIISLLHRFWFRKYVKEPRLDMTRANGEILLEIKETCFYTLDAYPAPEAMGNYKNSYILVGQELFYITSNGLVDQVVIRDTDKFLSDLAAVNPKNQRKFSLSFESTKMLITDNSNSLITDNATPHNNQGYVPLGGLDKVVCEGYRTTLRLQKEQLTEEVNKRALLGVAFSGVVDGLYIYMGAIGLTALTPPVFIAMTVFSAFFASVCVVTRAYEEYDYQRRFKSIQAKVELALCCKELEVLFGTFQRLSDKVCCSKLNNAELVMLFNEIAGKDSLQGLGEDDQASWRTCLEEANRLQQQLNARPAGEGAQDGVDELRTKLIDKLKKLYKYELIAKKSEFSSKRKDVRSLVTTSSSLAVFAGMRHGLAAYSAITGLMFAFATIEAMFLTPFSPAVLIAGVMIGMVSLAICLIHSLTNIASEPNQIEGNDVRLDEVGGNVELFRLLVSLKDPAHNIQDTSPVKIKKAVLGAMNVDAPPRYLIWERFEIFRSLGSGFTKGPKLIALFYSMFVSSAEGDHDTPVLFRIAIVGALIQAVVFALRAYARGLGKDAPDDPLKSAAISLPQAPSVKPPSDKFPPDDRDDEFSPDDEFPPDSSPLSGGPYEGDRRLGSPRELNSFFLSSRSHPLQGGSTSSHQPPNKRT